MTKKQILIASMTSGLTIILIAGAAIIFMLANSTNKDVQNSVAGNIASSDLNNSSSTIPLGQSTKPRSGLSVDDSANNGVNLGSGNTATSSNTASTTAPSAQDFKQYEQYKDKQEVYFGDLVEGTGAVAQKDSVAAVTYKGYLTNGSLFDQSRTGANGQKEPLIFTLGSDKLIAGFEQGVAGMKAGGTRRIIIPPSLAYGDTAKEGIPVNSVLIFDVQLLTVQ